MRKVVASHRIPAGNEGISHFRKGNHLLLEKSKKKKENLTPQEIILKLREVVEQKCHSRRNPFGPGIFDHVIQVVDYAKNLAKEVGADAEIVEIAAILHDIGSIQGKYKNHHISGAKEAERLLKKLDYPTHKIEAVVYCISVHRASFESERKTPEARVVASADAMSHMTNLPGLFFVAFKVRRLNARKAKEWVKQKIQRSWNKLMPEAKEIIKEKYTATMRLLE